MTPAPICILYTQDAELVRRTRAFLRSMSQLRHVNDPDRLESVLQQTGQSVLMMDLRSKECRELIDQIQNEQPEVLIIAFGVGQSETLREAEQFGIYAAEEIGLERDRKSTRLNSSHANISYAVFCLKKNTAQLQSRQYLVCRLPMEKKKSSHAADRWLRPRNR